MSKSSDAAIKAGNDEREANYDQALAVNNMRIWNKVSRTDPDHTKTVEFGRKFTAIDAHSQIKAATEQFGPIGSGWGYETVYGFQNIGEQHVAVWCDLTLWWKAEGAKWEGNSTPGYQCNFGPIRGMALLTAKDKTKLPDTDATKKAMTDALTKGLSHLGFNADVFLGQFDDNKYVTELRKDKAANVEKEAAEYAEKRSAFIKEIEGSLSGDGIDVVVKNYEDWLGTLAPGTLAELKKWVAKKELELANVKE